MKAKTAVLLSFLFLTFTVAAAQSHSPNGENVEEDYIINISERLPSDEPYQPLNWTEAEVEYHAYKANDTSIAETEDRFPETSGEQSFIESLGGLYSILLAQVKGFRESEKESIDTREHRNDFNATGDFNRIHWSRYSESGDLFTFASTEEWEYLLKNGEIIEQSRAIDNVQITEDSIFYSAYSHGTNQELIYNQEVLTEINRRDGINNVASHESKPVYVVFDADQDRQKVYKGDQLIYESINGSLGTVYNLNGELAFKLTQESGEYLLVGEKKYGPVENLADAAYTGERFCLTETRTDTEEENEVVHCGDEKISQQVRTGNLDSLNGQIVFKAEKSVDGNPSVRDNILIDGESVASHRKILQLEVGEDELYYTALNKDGTQGLYSSEGEIDRFSALSDLEIIDGRPATSVRSGGDWSVYFNGSVQEPGFENIFYLQGYDGEPIYVGTQSGEEKLMHGDESIVNYTALDISRVSSTDESFSYTLDNLSEATFGYNGKEGITVETEYPAQFTFNGAAGGEPVYSYWEVREGPDYGENPREGRVLVKGDKIMEKAVALHGAGVVDDRVIYANEDQLMLLDSFTSRRFDEVPFDMDDDVTHGHNPFINGGEIVYTPMFDDFNGDETVAAYRNDESLVGTHGDLSQLEVFDGKVLALGVSRDDFEGDIIYLGKEPIINTEPRWGPILDRELFSESARKKLQEEINPGEAGYDSESSFMRLYSNGEDRFAVSIKTEDGRTRHNKLAVFERNGNGRLDVEIEQIGRSKLKGSGYDAEREHFDYQQVLDGKFIGGDFVFWSSGWTPYRTSVYSDGSFGETYQDIGKIFDVGGEVAYTAYENNTWYLVKDGEQVASSDSEFNNIKVLDGKLTYRVKDTINHGERSYSYDSIGDFMEIGDDLAFVYSENNTEKLWWGGNTVDEVEADIKHLNEKDGEPLYLVDYFDRKEIVLNGEKLAETPAGSEIFTGEGMIGYRTVEEHEGRNAKLVRT